MNEVMAGKPQNPLSKDFIHHIYRKTVEIMTLVAHVKQYFPLGCIGHENFREM